MEQKNTILLVFLGIILTLSISTSYYRFIVLHDYIIETKIDCDPSYESCFVWECDPESEECTGNIEEDTWYYKFVQRNAKNILPCGSTDEVCDQFTCSLDSEVGCKEILCSQSALTDYNLSNTCTILDDFSTSTIIN